MDVLAVPFFWGGGVIKICEIIVTIGKMLNKHPEIRLKFKVLLHDQNEKPIKAFKKMWVI